MSRHSKNRTDRPHFTYSERQEAGYASTRAERLSSEAHLPFGYCSLSLKAAKVPVASPYGHIYDREFIIEFLANQKSTMIQKKQEEEKIVIQKKIEEDAQLVRKRDRDIREFEELENRGGVGNSLQGMKRQRVEFEGVDKDKAKQRNFWINPQGSIVAHSELMASSEVTGSSKGTSVTGLAKSLVSSSADQNQSNKLVTKCPFTNQKLRLKDLIPINFEVCDQKLIDDGGGRGMYCCALTKKPITHQKVVLIKPSGQVILEQCLKECNIFETYTCPITNKPLTRESSKECNRSKDIIPLLAAGTAFSSHNEVEVKSFNMLSAKQVDNGERGGFVGAKGTVFR